MYRNADLRYEHGINHGVIKFLGILSKKSERIGKEATGFFSYYSE